MRCPTWESTAGPREETIGVFREDFDKISPDRRRQAMSELLRAKARLARREGCRALQIQEGQALKLLAGYEAGL